MDKRKNFIKLLFIGVILFSLGACASTSKTKSEVNYEDLIGAYVYEKKGYTDDSYEDNEEELTLRYVLQIKERNQGTIDIHFITENGSRRKSIYGQRVTIDLKKGTIEDNSGNETTFKVSANTILLEDITHTFGTIKLKKVK